MVAVRHMQTGFIAGETSPLMNGRVETDHHTYGLATCENFVPFLEGPLVKRPGFQMVCAADPTTAWLGAFRFNVTQEYLLEWGEQKLRFFTNGIRLDSAPGIPIELATPYAADEAALLSTAQSFDRLYLAHPAHPPAALARTGAAAFTHAPLTLNNGPFDDENIDKAKTVQVSATTGTGITITASAAVFDPGMIGSSMRIDAIDFSTIKVWEPGMKNVAAGEIVRSDGKAYTALTSGTTGSSTPIHQEGSEWDGQLKLDINDKGPFGVQWQYRHGRYGVVRITGVTSATVATAGVVTRLPDSITTNLTYRWRTAFFSAKAGWPSLVFRWLGRLGFFKGYDLVASAAGDFGGGTVNFATETSSGNIAADLAFRRRLDADNVPLWAIVDRDLTFGTATREFAVQPANAAVALSGDNIKSAVQSKYGSEPIDPVEVGTQTVFVERGGRRLRAADYDYARDRYDAPDLTAAAAHVTLGGMVQLTSQRVPQTMVIGVRADGQLIVHPLTRGEVKGFARVVLGGGARALSAVSIVGADGRTDELWLLIERQQAGAPVREIWKQTPWRELGDDAAAAVFVDGAVTIAATADQTTFTGLTHLAGQAVAVLADGAVVPDLIVSDAGVLTLAVDAIPINRAYTVTVGLPYAATAITRTPAIDAGGAPIQGLKMRWRRVVLRVLESIGLTVGQDAENLEELIDRSAADQMDAAIPLFSGDTPGPIDAEWRRDGSVRIVSSDPLPALVTAAMLAGEVDTADA